MIYEIFIPSVLLLVFTNIILNRSCKRIWDALLREMEQDVKIEEFKPEGGEM